MNYSSYKEFHESLMENNHGSSIAHVFLTILPTFFTTFLATNLIVLLQPLNTLAIFIIEFVFIVLTTILNVTVLNYKVHALVILLFVVVTTLIITQLRPRLHYMPFVQIPCQRPEYLNVLRANINLITAICILAVDFNCFPRQLAKTETFGTALMDAGVGIFVYGNGLVAPELYQTGAPLRFIARMKKVIWSCVPLFLLGAVRFVAINELDYQQHVTEYGVHWNFFITLALTKLIGSICIALVSELKDLKFVAVVIILIHELILDNVATDYVLDSENKMKRDTFLSANREGICSLPGYISLYLMSVYIGHAMKPTYATGVVLRRSPVYTSVRTVFWRIVYLCVGILVLWKITYSLDILVGISRRLANIGYVFWTLSLGLTLTVAFMILECFIYFRMIDLPHVRKFSANRRASDVADYHLRTYEPLILKAISYNGLAFFVLANLMTGVVNMNVQTFFVEKFPALVILTAYAFILCSIMTILYVKQIKLKVWWFFFVE